MKKILAIVVALMVAGIMFAENKKIDVSPVKTAVAKEAAVKSEPVSVPAFLSKAEWDKITAPAVQLDADGKYLEAADAYLAAGEIAKKVKDGYDQARWAWMLNDAALMIINQYKKDGKTDLSKAKAYLDEAGKIDSISDECKRCIKSNSEYIDYVSKLRPAIVPVDPLKKK